jgi:hypothetical protein
MLDGLIGLPRGNGRFRIAKKESPKNKSHDERFTMAHSEKGHGLNPPMASEFL